MEMKYLMLLMGENLVVLQNLEQLILTKTKALDFQKLRETIKNKNCKLLGNSASTE